MVCGFLKILLRAAYRDFLRMLYQGNEDEKSGIYTLHRLLSPLQCASAQTTGLSHWGCERTAGSVKIGPFTDVKRHVAIFR